MDSLPSAPVLSVPQYPDGIQPALDAYSPTLCSRFEALLTTYSGDVFPDPPKLKLSPKHPEDLSIIEEPGSMPVLEAGLSVIPPADYQAQSSLSAD
eukprot:3815897-Rhodomonas_salina.2